MHDVPLPGELGEGSRVRTIREAYWYQEIPVGTVGVVHHLRSMGGRREAVVDVEIRGQPFRVSVPEDVLVVA